MSKYISFRSSFEASAYTKAISESLYSISLDFPFNNTKLINSVLRIAKLLIQNKVDCVVVGLDSDPEQRLIINICKRLKIPVILVQDGVWIFNHPPKQSKTNIFLKLLKDLVKLRYSSIIYHIKILACLAVLGDIRACGFGCGGADKIAVFSEETLTRLLRLGVAKNSIVITGSIAAYLDRQYSNSRSRKKQISSLNSKNEFRRLLIISQPLDEINVDLQSKVFSSIASALEKLNSLGWHIFIRLHPREEETGWRTVFDNLKTSVKPTFSYNINWNNADVVVGFSSTLLINIVLDKIPLIVYNMEDEFIDQNSFLNIECVKTCHDCDSLVNALMNYNFDEVKLNLSYESAKSIFGFDDSVVEDTVSLIENIK